MSALSSHCLYVQNNETEKETFVRSIKSAQGDTEMPDCPTVLEQIN